MRNPTAREKLAEFDALTIDTVAELITERAAKRGIESWNTPSTWPGSSGPLPGHRLMRALDADAVDESFLETAVAFVARGLLDGPPPPSP